MSDEAKITQARVLEALSSVMDPELEKDLVSLNMISGIEIDGDRVNFKLTLTTTACPLKGEIEDAARDAVLAIEGVTEVTIDMDARVPEARRLPEKEPIPYVKNTIAVASGKGGVGKSTVSVNLALALAKSGANVGLLDIDVYGPSIPMMMGINEPLNVNEEEKLLPHTSHGIKLISVGFMIDEETPLIWRGPLVMQLVTQFLTGVHWGKLDYLVIDLPPGTGDAQLTLVQTIPLSGAVIVTTPQDVALIDARRAIKMFDEVEVPILGIVENMSHFVCPHCEESTEIFSSGGAIKTSTRYDVPVLASLALDPEIRIGGDKGTPIVEADPDCETSKLFKEISEKVAARLSVLAITGD